MTLRRNTFLFCAVFFLIQSLNSQNLVQNPGFEAPTQWDSLWVLSLTNPSSATAVATEITVDTHAGTRSVELTNSQFNRWTYFYTDSINAPISFLARKSYEVSGWFKSLETGKEATFSILWNGSRQEQFVYAGNPDPDIEPEWFLVKDTITPEADFNDCYLSVGFRAGKDGLLATGRLLIDDFALVRIPDISETEILEFSIPGQTKPSLINDTTGNLFVEMPEGTDLTALAPDRITLSRGATVVPAAEDTVDFSSPVIFTVTAQDGMTLREWTVTVGYPPSNETDIVFFFLDQQTNPPVIDTATHTVVCEVAYGTIVSSLVPQILISEGATIDPPGGTTLDFSTPVIYQVTAEDGVTIQDWTVSVNIAPPLTGTDIISFLLPGQVVPAVIDTLTHVIHVDMPNGSDLTNLAPEIEVSEGATIDPESGAVRDFSVQVIYLVTAQDGMTTQEWTVVIQILPSTQTDILSFTLAEQTGLAVIDTAHHTVDIEVTKETDLKVLSPEIQVSEGANIDPASSAVVDFSESVIYTVIAEDGISIQTWTVTVTLDPALSATGNSERKFFLAYPNPSDGTLNITMQRSGSIIVRDIMGRSVEMFNEVDEGSTVTLSLTGKGLYLIHVTSDGESCFSKVLIR